MRLNKITSEVSTNSKNKEQKTKSKDWALGFSNIRSLWEKGELQQARTEVENKQGCVVY